jgi:cytochrome c oxidase subunit IV
VRENASADAIKQLKLNQNLWALLLSLGALGAADYFKLSATFRWLSLILAIVMTLSVLVTTAFYRFITVRKNAKNRNESDHGQGSRCHCTDARLFIRS